MLEALSRTGWRNYSLFLRENGLLVGYLETDDFQAAVSGMAATDVNARWQATMQPFFEALDGRRPDEGTVPLEEVFHLARYPSHRHGRFLAWLFVAPAVFGMVRIYTAVAPE